ncbi:ABC transporter substrate-binding protein [Rhizobium sp. AN80A]|uniref:ABC transporter substrate-binding protein n=1 Tax=Rhizobium sp. AN80A TaxID=3040673 RepID=UPI0024B3332F|nr:ABC transporter substrate-binding protein [Rhizobium sp. AN80A]
MDEMKTSNAGSDSYVSSRDQFALGRRSFLVGAAAGIGAGLIGLPALAEEKPKTGGNLKLAIGGASSTDSLDPATYQTMFHVVLARSWGDTLVETHPETGVAVPSLAESWEESEGGKVWRFKIRKGVEFHDGSKLSVKDAIRTIQRHSDAASKSGALGYLSDIASIEADGDFMVITLKSANADMPTILSMYNLVIQPDGGYSSPTAGVGTGPYTMTNFNAGVRATLKKAANDWRSDRGFVENVELLAMNDVSARTAALVSGQVHLINQLNPNTVGMLEKTGRVVIFNTPGRMHYTMPMISNKAPFDNNDLRLAMKYAIDREAVVKQVLNGYGSVGNDIPVNSLYDNFPADLPQRAYDPDKAAFHMKKSGFNGTIQLSAADVMAGGVDMALIFQQSARKAGINVDVQRVPQDGYWSNVWRVKPFYLSYYGSRLTQDMIYSMEFSRSSAANECFFDNDEFETLLVQARGTTDASLRGELYAKIAKIVHEQSGTIIPVFINFINAASPKLKGYKPDVGNDLANGYVASRVWLEA